MLVRTNLSKSVLVKTSQDLLSVHLLLFHDHIGDRQGKGRFGKAYEMTLAGRHFWVASL